MKVIKEASKKVSYIGQIDVWTSIVDMLNNSPHMSIANYIKEKDHPSLLAEGFYETDYKKKKKSNTKKEKPISTPKPSNDTTES